MSVFMPFDLVNYKGFKFKELKSKLGEVVAHVKDSGAYVVDFGMEQAYLVSGNSLERWRPSPKDLKEGKAEPTVEIRRRRKSDDEE